MGKGIVKMTIEERERRSKIRKVFGRLDKIAFLLDELGDDPAMADEIRAFKEYLEDTYKNELVGA